MALRRPSPGLMVIGLDGLPFSLAERLLADGTMPALAHVVDRGWMQQMDSVLPTVSCVAWTTMLTGVQPGKHGLYGFIHRRAASYEVEVCSTQRIRRKLLPELLSDAGRTALSMNVPVTTPPRPINGVMIGCFLSNSLETVAWPRQEGAYLASMGYRIDTDAAAARRSVRGMLDDVRRTAERRVTAALHYLEQRPWDCFHVHLMETDRLNHFLLGRALGGDAEFAPAFFAAYRELDAQVGRLLEAAGEETPLLVLSDHGFEPLRREVQLSRWLVERGWTVLTGRPVGHPLDFDPSRTRAYTLIPGQVYLNLEGREPRGIVPRRDYFAVRESVARELAELRDPDTGQQVIERVWRREEIFWPSGQGGPQTGATPEALLEGDATFGLAPDLLAEGRSGYDLKMGLGKSALFETTELEGMHTRRDALLAGRGLAAPRGRPSIVGCLAMILKHLAVDAPPDLDA